MFLICCHWALASGSLRPILPAMIFQAYLAEALLFKPRSVALSSSVQGHGLVKGDREREDFRGEVFFVVGWVVDFLVRRAFVGGSTVGVALSVDGKGM